MYVVAEEDNEESAGTVVIVSSNWFTPKKSESFWPPTKTQASFNKLLKNHENPHDDWSLIKIKSKFYECEKREMNASLNEGHYSPPQFVTSRPPSPAARFPAEKSGPCELNGIHNYNVTASSPLAAHHTSTLPAAKTGPCELNGIHRGSQDWANYNVTASSPLAAHHTSTLPAAKTGYDYNVMQMLTTIKEQNTVILEWIRKQNANEFQFKQRDLQLPVEFPSNDYEHLLQLESLLASNQNFTDLCEYFGEFAGPTVTGTVNNILKHTLTNRLAATYSFRGKKGKRAFEDLTLKTAIVRAVKKICNVVRDQPIEDDMKVWLKHAPQRIILQEKKNRARLDRTVLHKLPSLQCRS